MKRKMSLYILTGIAGILTANDGSYYTSGNQLIPMIETRIQVKKEILTLKRINESELQVTVYYEFFNPDAEKTLDVGFEAASPSGDVDVTPKNGQHPNINDFTVNMNDMALPYKVAIVGDSLYYKNGRFIPKTSSEIKESIANVNYADFQYAYHFKAIFKKGTNIIKHTYRFKLSSSVDLHYDFYYILTAAKRWGNRQIDDFTLEIDMGELQSFRINHGFFGNHKDWNITGIGVKKSVKTDIDYLGADSAVQFDIRNGSIVFKKMNFRPKSELFLYAQRHYYESDTFDYTRDILHFYIDNPYTYGKDELSLKILKNLPYARRGYVFKNAELRAYFEKMEWYVPDVNYVPELGKLTKQEQEWLKSLSLGNN